MIKSLLALACLLPSTAFAQSSLSLDYLTMSMGLFGGLALFLYGMEKMSHSLKQAAGSKMKQVLATLTKSRISGVFTGAGLPPLSSLPQ